MKLQAAQARGGLQPFIVVRERQARKSPTLALCCAIERGASEGLTPPLSEGLKTSGFSPRCKCFSRARSASCLVGYSSPRCPRRRSRSRPMNHPITNAANRKAIDHAHAGEHIGENDSGAVFDGHGARRRFASMPLYSQSSGSPHRFMDRRRPAAKKLGPKTGLGHVFDCLLWIRRHQSSVGRGMPFSAASCLPRRHLSEGTANFAFVEPEREYGPAPFGRHSACTIC